MQRPLSLLSATLSDAVSVLSQSSLKEAQATEVIYLDRGAYVPLKIIMMMMSRLSPGGGRASESRGRDFQHAPPWLDMRSGEGVAGQRKNP